MSILDSAYTTTTYTYVYVQYIQYSLYTSIKFKNILACLIDIP